MKRVERSVTVQKSLPEVWSYLSDFRSTNDWDPGTVSTERVSGDGGIGTVYRNTSKFLGKETELTYTVVDLKPERMISLRGENDTVTTTDTLTLARTGSATTVHYAAEFAFKGRARYTEPLLSFPLKKLGDDAIASLGETLSEL